MEPIQLPAGLNPAAFRLFTTKPNTQLFRSAVVNLFKLVQNIYNHNLTTTSA